MSIVPYSANRQIVLRHNDSIVIYDPESKQFGVASNRGPDAQECPYCHRPLGNEGVAPPVNNDAEIPGSPGFVSPRYFYMLQDSVAANSTPGLPPSPQRRLVEPVRTIDDSIATGTDPEKNETDQGQPGTPSVGISASAFSPGYFKKFFIVEKELGRGGKGVVLLVTHMLDDVELGQYACKRVPVGNDHAWLIHVLNEVQLLEHLSHQHLVYYKHVWLEDVKISSFGPSVPCAFILQQYCNSGDLHQFMIQPCEIAGSEKAVRERVRRRSQNQKDEPLNFRGRKLRFEEIYSFFKDITSGLNHLHTNGFIHRDLKPSNCLLHKAGNELRVLVSDFGEVQLENMARRSTGATGTVSYCAPEVLRQDPDTGTLGNFTTKSDIFSLGMILYFLCFARLPYRHADHINEENENVDRLRAEIVTWTGLEQDRQLRPDLPEQLYTFLRRLLSLNSLDRPSAEEILLGIKTGIGLEDFVEARPAMPSHIFEDLSASSRISSADSPRTSSPARKESFSGPKSARRPTRIRLPSMSRNLSIDEHELQHTPTTEPRSPNGSLVLSNRRSPSQIRNEAQGSLQTLHHRHTRPWPLSILTQSSSSTTKVKIALLLVKILSLHLPCSPMAIRAPIIYSLLILAFSDFYTQNTGVMVSTILSVLHCCILIIAGSRGKLCVGHGEFLKVS